MKARDYWNSEEANRIGGLNTAGKISFRTELESYLCVDCKEPIGMHNDCDWRVKTEHSFRLICRECAQKRIAEETRGKECLVVMLPPPEERGGYGF